MRFGPSDRVVVFELPVLRVSAIDLQPHDQGAGCEIAFYVVAGKMVDRAGRGCDRLAHTELAIGIDQMFA